MTATKPSSTYLAGVILTLLSAVGYSTKAIFVKLAYRYGVDAVTMLTLRMAMSAPLFAGAVLLHGPSRRGLRLLTRSDVLLLFVTGCLGFYLASAFDFAGLQYISAGLERIVLFSYPSIVVIVSALLFGERVTRSQALALIACTFGIIVSFAGELGGTEKNAFLGASLVFVSALTYACYIMGSGRLIKRIGSLTCTSFALLFASAAIAIHFLVTHPVSALSQPREVYVLSALMAVISTVLPSFMLAIGIGRVGANTAAILSTIGPVATITMADFLLGETTTGAQLFGGTFVVAGVLLISVKRREPRIEQPGDEIP